MGTEIYCAMRNAKIPLKSNDLNTSCQGVDRIIVNFRKYTFTFQSAVDQNMDMTLIGCLSLKNEINETSCLA